MEVAACNLSVDDFQYQPLPETSAMIRLLFLLPGERDQDIQCRVKHSRLDEEPAYEAISYCWGDKNDPVKIRCNNRTTRITRSLYSALRHFRHPQKVRVLWADAICINQSNPREKAHQVQLMRDIYRQAQRVLIWLGGEAEGSKRVERLIQLVNQELNDSPGLQRTVFSSPFHPESTGTVRDIANRLPDANGPEWEAFRALLKRPWFSRIWIVQEVAFAREIQVHCGDSNMEWDPLINLLQFAGTSGFIELTLDSGFTAAMALNIIRFVIQQDDRQPLLTLLLRFISARASEPRDKIYALLGLSDSTLAPNYELSITEAYKVAAIHIITTTRNLDLLSFPPGRGERRNIDLPSWVPDWEILNQRIQGLTRQDIGKGPYDVPRFHAAGDYTIINPKFEENNNLMRLDGHFIDEIEGLAYVVELEVTPSSPLHRLELECRTHKCLLNWEQTARLNEQNLYRNGQSMADAYWQTLQAGWYPRGIEFHRGLFNCFNQYWAVYRYLHKNNIPCIQAMGVCMVVRLAYDLSRGFQHPNVFDRPSLSNGPGFDPALFYGFCKTVPNRRLFRSKEGYIGLAPGGTKRGDKIALVKGSKIPLILREVLKDQKGLCMQQPLIDQTRWLLVGDAYVHGVMFGEAFEEAKCRTLRLV